VNSSEQLWRDIFAVGDNMRAIHADSRRVSMFYQMTVSQLKMVRAVYELTSLSGAGVALKVVAKELETTAAAASEMVDVLVRKKILERNQDPNDRRQVRIQLADELFSCFKRIEERFTDVTSEFAATLTTEEQAVFCSCTAKFKEFVLNCRNEERK
jgi:DNA-binding MarR family transcriptional regulator